MPYKNIEDKRASRMRSYYKHREKELAYEKERIKTYRLTPQYHKTHTISNWKFCGLIETEDYSYDDLYEAYMAQGECESCGKVFIDTKNKHMDHDHKTGLFRDVVCCRCNVLRRYEDASN